MLRSGTTFNSADLQQQQADDFLNPGMLWVDQGQGVARGTRRWRPVVPVLPW
jgi:hypothetical protein